MKRGNKMKDLKVIGSMGITNSLALEVYGYEYGVDDKIIYKYSNENKYRKVKLYESTKGIYFNTPTGRTYLNEIIRIN